MVSQGLSLGNIGWAFTHIHGGNWHPLTTMVHMLDCQLYGLWPGGHHLTNVFIHAACAVCLFLMLLDSTGAVWPCAFVAAVFAVHPLRVESVAWVSELKDVLSGLFFMLTLWAYMHRVRERYARHYAAVMVWFVLGLLSKPMLVTVPFVLLLLDYWPLGRLRSRVDFYLEARDNLATALVQTGRIGEAIAYAEDVASRHPNDPNILHTLGTAYARAGRLPDAIRVAQRALQLAQDQSNPALEAALLREIQVYQSGPAPGSQ